MSTSEPQRVLVTGATGLIGWSVVQALVRTAVRVRVLARNPAAAAAVLPHGVEIVLGDLTDADSLRRALRNCHTVFHTAGMPEQWVRDTSMFHRVNVEGTRSLVRQALKASVSSFVYTSTIDVFSHRPGVRYDESELAQRSLSTPYERSKQLADQVVAQAISQGLPGRFIHPAGVFGPSPTRTPGLNDMLAKLATGRLPALPPGGVPVVYAPDLASGQLAASNAQVGSRFILCDRYVPFKELAELVTRATGTRRPPQLSFAIAGVLSQLTELAARFTHRAPLLPSGQLHFMQSRHEPDSTKAHTELGWTCTLLADAIADTLTDRGIALRSPHSA